MPVVSCPHCTNPVTLPKTWTGSAYTCPHCRRVVPAKASSRPTAAAKQEEEEDAFSIDADPDPVVRSPRRKPDSAVMDFITFRWMLTPALIQVVFWIGLCVCLFVGVRTMAASFDAPASSRSGWGDRDSDREFLIVGSNPDSRKKAIEPETKFSALTFVSGLAIIVFGPMFLRLYCEAVIIFFKIHDELKTANDRQQYRT